MKHFCENEKCIFYDLIIKYDDHIVSIDGKRKIKRYLNKIGVDGSTSDVWLCECCTGVLELVNNLMDFNNLKDGVVN
jgi:hypothetical protein